MRRMLSVVVAFLPLAIPALVFAKADISKITIKGSRLKTPVEITDPKTQNHASPTLVPAGPRVP
jgi:hypothetical protein